MAETTVDGPKEGGGFLDEQVDSAKALRAADDFLVGLMRFTEVTGYEDPNVGGVSALFVLAQVRAARFGSTLGTELQEAGSAGPQGLRFLNDERKPQDEW